MAVSDVFITDRELKRDFLLRFNGMHRCCRMTWGECANVYEHETGEKITSEALRSKVRRAVRDAGFVRVTEFPEKVVVSVQELTVHGCIWCAIRRFFTKIMRFLTKFSRK